VRFIRHLLLSPDDAPGGSTPPPAASIVDQGKLGEGDAAELVRLRQEKSSLEGRLQEAKSEADRLRTPPQKKKGFFDAVAEYFPAV